MARSAALPALKAESGLSHYLEEIRRFPMLEPQEEYMLARSWREHGDREAAHKLVTSHLRLVAKIAMGYRGYGLPISEVVSEGNVGLMQAVKRFEPEKGFRLATYAMWWIKAAIQEYILRSWSLVKMGTTANQKKLFFNLRKAKSKISALDEGDLRPDQVKLIAKRLGVTEQDVVDMNRRLGGDASLNAPIRDDGDSGEWMDWLVNDAPSQERVLADSEESDNRHQALIGALDVLNERERRIFEARRLADDPITLEDLASEFGVSRERVRQIEVRAFEKVQKAVKNQHRRHGEADGNAGHRRDGALDRSAATAGLKMAGHCPGHFVCSVSVIGGLILLPPGAERFLEGAHAGRALLHRENGALAAGIDNRNVEPVALLQQLDIALHVDVDRRQADQEIAVGDLHREAGERHAARLLVLLHQHAGNVGDAAFGEIRRQREHDLDGVARRQRLVGIAAERPGHAHVALGNFHVGADREFGRQPRPRRHGLGAPERRADITLALRIARILVVEHDLLRDRGGRRIGGCRRAGGRPDAVGDLRPAGGLGCFVRLRRRRAAAQARHHRHDSVALPVAGAGDAG